MKKHNRVLTFVLALAAMVSMVTMPSSATSLDSHSDATYNEITREQYVAHIAQKNGISYDTAEEEVSQAILATIDKHNIPVITPFGFEETNSEYIGGVKTSYGYWVSNKVIPNTGGDMSVRMSVYSILVSAQQGTYISHVDDSLDVLPGDSGIYTITASGNVRWDDYTVHLSSSGNAEITYDTAVDFGLDAEWISFGQSLGTATYLRYPFTLGETFRISNI